jgi:peptide deformylase
MPNSLEQVAVARPPGKIRAIRIYGDPCLRQKALRVEKINIEMQQLIADLVATMIAKDGLGLAATQIGELEAIIALHPKAIGIESEPLVLVNPEIVECSGEIEREEACLSLPGISEVLSRPAKIRVRAQDAKGKVIEVTGEGTLARALCHEIDHLTGVLFIDHLPAIRRRLLKTRLAGIEQMGKSGQTRQEEK